MAVTSLSKNEAASHHRFEFDLVHGVDDPLALRDRQTGEQHVLYGPEQQPDHVERSEVDANTDLEWS